MSRAAGGARIPLHPLRCTEVETLNIFEKGCRVLPEYFAIHSRAGSSNGMHRCSLMGLDPAFDIAGHGISSGV